MPRPIFLLRTRRRAVFALSYNGARERTGSSYAAPKRKNQTAITQSHARSTLDIVAIAVANQRESAHGGRGGGGQETHATTCS